MSIEIDNQTGLVITETVDGCTMPADYSFQVINDFVNRSSTDFEDLQALCLGMSSRIEALEKERIALQDQLFHARQAVLIEGRKAIEAEARIKNGIRVRVMKRTWRGDEFVEFTNDRNQSAYNATLIFDDGIEL